ncbi:MAG: hypothetical protein RL748_2425 [Pseudomonadota bacterium]|jgi:CRISPR-associated protein Cmr1
MPNYTKISAEFELVTPAFIGGANKDKVGCIDPKALKAALRHWWRVLNWPRIQKAEADERHALACLHQAEMRLFGFASTKNHGGQGLVQVIVQHKTGLQQWPVPKLPLNAGLIYLLGQGLYQTESRRQQTPAKILRPAIDTGTFSVTLILHCPGLGFIPKQDETRIIEALKAFGLLGNLGSRQNRGFGSVRMTKLNEQAFAQDESSYIAALKELFALPAAPFSLLPSFCEQARMRLVVPDQSGHIQLLNRNDTSDAPRPTRSHTQAVTSAWQLLSQIGEEFLLERSSGYPADNKLRKTLGGFTAQCFYEPDHHWISKAKKMENELNRLPPHKKQAYTKEALNPEKIPPPVRIIYGLPYGFDEGKEISVKLPGQLLGRRASPLHMHITHLGAQAAAVLYTLPSVFLPEGSDLHIKLDKADRSGHDLPVSKVTFDFAKIDDFLNRFTSAKKLL